MNVPVKTRAEYAGFWVRAAALVIDQAILIGGGLILIVLAELSTPGAVEIFSLLVTWLYYALMESSSRQATLGKFALGLTVTDLRGERVSFGRATGRFFARIFSGLIFGIGYLMPAFTERKQALHDMMAGCLVIRKKAGQGNPVSEHVPRRVWNDIEGWVSLCTECGRTSRAHSTICDHCGHRLHRSGGIADDPTMRWILMGGLGSAVLLFLVSALILGILR